MSEKSATRRSASPIINSRETGLWEVSHYGSVRFVGSPA